MAYVGSYAHCVFSTKDRRPFMNPEAPHRKMTFQEEFIARLKKHRIDCEERYLWE